jgi:hypothetical protein
MNTRIIALSVGVLALTVGIWKTRSGNDRVDFSTQVKPILNKNCMACHGGVKRAGGLSLLFRDEALAPTESGKPAILPGDAANSEFIKRLHHADPEERMPLKSDPLKAEEIDILTKWIDEGAEWGDHWAYVAPEARSVPNPEGLFAGFGWGGTSWVRNDVDRFVLDRLKKEGLEPADEADRETLLRRVSLDLTGLPPTPNLRAWYLANDSENAYEQLVDSLLASPHFGERWASVWLDLARYSDSRGYQKDNGRSIWQYRDYVIRSYNADKPFDQFTVEQLAGDLLPNRNGGPPTDEQLIATAFHRNTMNNDETGTVDEEFRVAALLDRVNTTWDTWHGTTFACVQCHSHPYDPFRHEEYYQFMAFFNNTRDEDTQDEAPTLRTFSPEDQPKFDALNRYLAQTTTPEKAREWANLTRFIEPRFHAHYADRYVDGALVGDRAIGLRNGGSCRLPNLKLDGKTDWLAAISVKQPGGVLEIRDGSPTGPLLKTVRLDTTDRGRTELRTFAIPPQTGRHDWYLVGRNPKLGPRDDVFQIGWFALLDEFPGKAHPAYAAQRQAFVELLNAKTQNTPILLESHPDYRRKSHVFVRGNWLVNGPEVQPAVPRSLHAFPKGTPNNRLGLARWLVSRDNPLTARTVVNRFWEQLFGTGLVETLEDFGTQGFTPSHPELLDYLAVWFMDSAKWRSKPLLKLLVTSAAYRQSSGASDDLIERDPANRLLARGPRMRLTAEQVRDQTLAISGLLSRKMYGKPVMPYQPEGVWQAVNSSLNWKQSEGEDQYRRAIYTFARRTGPYPSMSTFDAGSREICQTRRIRTNTPLQALVLLNDPVFVEAARHLATSVEKPNQSADEAIAEAYARAAGRAITDRKQAAFKNLYARSLAVFRAKPQKARDFLGTPGARPETAALTMVTQAILNLDELVVKE